MFELFIAQAPFEMPVTSNTLAPLSNEERRYCPVLFARGRPTQYLDKHEAPFPALVVEQQALYRLYTDQASVSFEWPALLRRHDDNVTVKELIHEVANDEIPWELLDYITDAIPEYKPEHIESAVAFHNATEKELPIRKFTTGMKLVWNDDIIAKDHPAREHCGEGPFLVVRDEECVVMFTRDRTQERVTNVKRGSERLVLESMTGRNTVIARGGFFKIAPREKLNIPKHERLLGLVTAPPATETDLEAFYGTAACPTDAYTRED